MTKKIKITGGVIVAVTVAVLYALHSSNDFQKAYKTYNTLAKKHVEAAYIPGVPDNPVRQKLNGILSQVLARPMSPKERLSLAEQGLAALKEGEKQIDDIGTIGEKVQTAITYMEEKNNSLGVLFSKSQGTRVITLAKEEFGIVADIRGLSYRANFHTAEIFNRIVLDKGELTKAYSSELNSQIPAVEEQFNKRSALYEQLKSVIGRMEKEVSTM